MSTVPIYVSITLVYYNPETCLLIFAEGLVYNVPKFMISDSYRPRPISPGEYIDGRKNPLRPAMMSTASGVLIVHFAMHNNPARHDEERITFAMSGLATVLELSKLDEDMWRIVTQPVNLHKQSVGVRAQEEISNGGIVVAQGGRIEKYFLHIPSQQDEFLGMDEETVYGIPPTVLAMA